MQLLFYLISLGFCLDPPEDLHFQVTNDIVFISWEKSTVKSNYLIVIEYGLGEVIQRFTDENEFQFDDRNNITAEYTNYKDYQYFSFG